jgi:hypothetical protein
MKSISGGGVTCIFGIFIRFEDFSVGDEAGELDGDDDVDADVDDVEGVGELDLEEESSR